MSLIRGVVVIPLLLAAGVYWPGLSGGFYFDDYVHILLNDVLRIDGLNWDALRLASISSTAGPLGRPLPMASFAIEAFFFGVNDPYHFKLVNLIIHLCNGLLVYGLLTRLLRVAAVDSGDGHQRTWAGIGGLVLTSWWLLHPLNVTSVLYVVQRMTSLSALFALSGLLGYVYCRIRGLDSGRSRWWWGAVALLSMGTVASAYCKENGLLTPVLAWLVEILIFRCRMPTVRQQRNLRMACVLLPVLACLGLVAYFLMRPNWAVVSYSRRPFTLEERLWTEGRVVWFYIRQLLLPHSASFSLYLDHFTLSKGLLQPWTTVPALLGHLGMVALAAWNWRRLPMLTLGILWFYVGHLLESTIIPLEIAYEHRNYLPGLGILLAVIALMGRIGQVHRRQALAVMMILIGLCGLITVQRSLTMGNAMLYPIQDAERNQASARANFDAGRALTVMMELDPSLIAEYYPRALVYFQRSTAADAQGLASFTGMLSLLNVVKQDAPPGFVDQFAKRLREGVPPNATQMISRALTSHLALSRPAISHSEGERLYQAAIENPALKGYPKAAWQAGYAMFVSNVLGEKERGLRLMQQATDTSPFNAELRMLEVAMLVDMNRLNEAENLMDRASSNDRKGFLTKNLASMKQEIDARKKSSNVRTP